MIGARPGSCDDMKPRLILCCSLLVLFLEVNVTITVVCSAPFRYRKRQHIRAMFLRLVVVLLLKYEASSSSFNLGKHLGIMEHMPFAVRSFIFARN